MLLDADVFVCPYCYLPMNLAKMKNVVIAGVPGTKCLSKIKHKISFKKYSFSRTIKTSTRPYRIFL